MSSGSPIRPSGQEATMASRNRWRVSAIILLSKGPGATALTVTPCGASRQGDARACLRELRGHPVAHVGLAGGDVDLGAGLDEAARDHEPDAARAAGHQSRLARDGEQVLHGCLLSRTGG